MKLEDIKNKTKDAVDHLVQSLESGQSNVLTEYLGAMARFHTYSFGNVMLIARQKPDATNVAGIRTWNSLGRFVKRGEEGIRNSEVELCSKHQWKNTARKAQGSRGPPFVTLLSFRADCHMPT